MAMIKLKIRKTDRYRFYRKQRGFFAAGHSNWISVFGAFRTVGQ
jgi:hypothetical protein